MKENITKEDTAQKTVNDNIVVIGNMIDSIIITKNSLEKELEPILVDEIEKLTESEDVENLNGSKLDQKLKYIRHKLIEINIDLNDIRSRLTIEPFLEEPVNG